MKNINKIGMMIVAGGLLAATSCSDFSDYNTAPDVTANSAGKTLWENIATNPSLSDFASVLHKVGYDMKLSASRNYTVWAPVNGSFNMDSLMNVSNAKIEKEFVKCHIADFSHQETDLADTTIYVLNKKLLKFSNKNSADLKFDGKRVLRNGVSYNQPCSNGLLYRIDGKSDFRHNGYEYISELGGVASKFMKYVKKYEQKQLDYEKSVKGEIINGVQHYDDSVVTVSNDFIKDLNYTNDKTGDIYLNSEDSIATLLILNDAAWDKTYKKIASYYNYITPLTYQNLKSNEVGATTKGGSCPTTATGKATILDATKGKTDVVLATPPSGAEFSGTVEYWQDSITKRAMLKHIIFSHSNNRNKKFATGEAFEENDTIRSTKGNGHNGLIADPRLLDAVTENTVALSNGNARILNDFPFEPAKSYAPVIRTRTPGRVVTTATSGDNKNEYESWLLKLPPSSPICTMDADDVEKDQGVRYIKTQLPYSDNDPAISTASFAPEVDFYIDGVLSTTYDVYLVMVPAWLDNPSAAHVPYTLRVDINYTDANNKQIAGRFNGKGVVTTAADITRTAAFTPAAEKIDTVMLGRVTFPVCYANTDAKPNIKVMHTLSTFNKTNKTKYTQELRIANIILRPVDENEQ